MPGCRSLAEKVSPLISYFNSASLRRASASRELGKNMPERPSIFFPFQKRYTLVLLFGIVLHLPVCCILLVFPELAMITYVFIKIIDFKIRNRFTHAHNSFAKRRCLNQAPLSRQDREYKPDNLNCLFSATFRCCDNKVSASVLSANWQNSPNWWRVLTLNMEIFTINLKILLAYDRLLR